MQLGHAEARVLGCLVEKELTTPDYYPLTLNALQTACNQSSNRDPVTSYGEATVIGAIDALREAKLVRWVKAARSRSAKYRHDLEEAMGLDVPSRSVLAVLLLRGPQTSGELRTRTDRYHPFASPADVEATLHSLRSLDTPLVERLERRPGQKEARWQELLSDRSSSAPAHAGGAANDGGPADPVPSTNTGAASLPSGPDLEAMVRELTERVTRLERELGLDEA